MALRAYSWHPKSTCSAYSIFHAADKKSKCVHLWWAATNVGESGGELGGSVQQNDRTVAGEWYRAFSFHSIVSTVHIVRSNIAVHSSTTQLLWTCHLFYTSESSRESAVRKMFA